MIRVRLPTTEPEDYDLPIYDSDDELRPKECKYHWATCDNDSCEVHEDQEIVNYQPKQARFKIPKPSNDQPEVDDDEAQRCQHEEQRFQNATEMSVNFQPNEKDPQWASYSDKGEAARRTACKNCLTAGNEYCYLHIFAQNTWEYISAVLGPNPRANTVIQNLDTTRIRNRFVHLTRRVRRHRKLRHRIRGMARNPTTMGS